MILMFVASMAAGVIWGVIPAIFKAYFNTNETLFTLMLNYVAMQIVTFGIVYWENPAGSNTVGIINSATRAGWLPELGGLTYGWNVVIVLVFTIGMYIYMKYSKQGYEVAVVGESQDTARYARINVKPRPPAVDVEIVWLAPLTRRNPAIPHIPPEIPIVRIMVRFTLMRA